MRSLTNRERFDENTDETVSRNGDSPSAGSWKSLAAAIVEGERDRREYMHRVRRMWAVALVLGAAACGTDRAEETEPPVATCGDFAHHALVLLVRDGHDFRSFWCPAPADTGLMLPQFEQQPDGRVELLVYPRDGESHQATDYRGVYGFRGGRPELHVDDLCDWVEIATASCSLE